MAHQDDEIDVGKLTLDEVAELLKAGVLSEEQLKDTQLADGLWDLRNGMERALRDPVSRDLAREKIMRRYYREHVAGGEPERDELKA